MKVKEQNNVMILLLFVLLCFVINNTLNTKVVAYAELGWVVDFRYGFCKRGFWGTLYHFFLDISDSPWNIEILQTHILFFHYTMVLVAVALILFLFKIFSARFEDKRFLIFYLFVFLVSSFFLKNSFDLNGYSFDLLIFNIYLIVLLLIFYQKLILASCMAAFGCLFNELACVFWVPVAFSFCFLFKPSRSCLSTYFGLVLPFFFGFITHSFGFPAEKLPLFYESFSIKIEPENMANIIKSFKDQYDIFNYILYRINFLSRHFFDLLFTFFVLGSVSLVFIVFSVVQLCEYDKHFNVLKFLLSVFIIFIPLTLFFVAIDFWRFAGFVVLNGFILNVVLIILSKNNINQIDYDRTSLLDYIKKSIFLLGGVLSSFSLFSPSLTSLGTWFSVVSPKTSINIVGTSSFVFYPLVYDFDLFYEMLSVVPINFNPKLRNQIFHNVYCHSSGGRIYGKLQPYGKVRIDVVANFNEDDPDKVKYIKIYDHVYEIQRDKQFSVLVDISRVQSKSFPIFVIVVEPSSFDWFISRVAVTDVDNEVHHNINFGKS